MKNMLLPLRSYAIACGLFALAAIGRVSAADSLPHQRVSLDAGWKFHLGDEWPEALHLDKSGAASGPAAREFIDAYWRSVDVPHDWAIELPFDPTADTGHGFKALGQAFPHNSIAWYRRHFELPATDSGKRIGLTFDGVFRDATVWVNGWLVRHHESGYSPFREDITDLVNFGGANTISVRVDASKVEGWFYEGAGIYRHVWLDKTAPVAIAPDGIFIYSEFKNNLPQGPATVHVQTTVLNHGREAGATEVSWRIVAPDGRTIDAAGMRQVSPLAAASPTEFSGEARIESPVLWSPETPKLYKLVTTVSTGNQVVDRQENAFGLRTIGFDPATGFLLNGQHYEIHGTCNHQDHAGVGAAVPDALQEFRVSKLKEFGCNAIRTSHNPPTPELLEACDRLGMLVMDESRLMGSDSDNLRKWEELIRRDRNHASVFLWSIANEEFSVQDSPQAANIARTMQDLAKRLDPTRSATYAAPEGNVFQGINAVIDVRGWNYHYGPDMDRYHAEHPNQPNIGTEQASVVGTRGIYANDPARGYVSAHDVVWPSWTTTAESWWSYFSDRPWLSGGFVWTGFDYRGEPTPYAWPCINSHFGILDTCGFPKDVFYYYQSWWTNQPVLHLATHWNWSGREGQEILVEAFSNCAQVELSLNGQSLGRQAMKRNSKLSWQVHYAPGTLSAQGFDAAGKVVAKTQIETTGPAAKILLTPDRTVINANGQDVAIFTVAALDSQGRVVPVAQDHVSFSIAGGGTIIGVGNGDPSCHEPDTFISSVPVRSIAVGPWRWKLTEVPHNRTALPEYAGSFDDSGWSLVKRGDDKMTIREPNASAVYRAHVTLTAEDLAGAGVQLRFGGCDEEGWYFVNNQFIGESHDWSAKPAFDLKQCLHVGDNVIAVGVYNGYGQGGLDPDVQLDVVGRPTSVQWSRSLFNGLAQIIVRSARTAGKITLTARAEGLVPATATVETRPGSPASDLP